MPGYNGKSFVVTERTRLVVGTWDPSPESTGDEKQVGVIVSGKGIALYLWSRVLGFEFLADDCTCLRCHYRRQQRANEQKRAES
jgi:hypothetical protein